MNAPQKMEAFPLAPQPTLQAVEQAADWHVLLHSADASKADRAAFEVWLNQDPDNAEAYKRLEALWEQFEGVEAAPAIAALESTLKQTNRRRKLQAKSIVFGLTLIIAGSFGIKTETAGYLMSDYSTAIGQQRVVELADHSRITLNTYSAIDVDMSTTERHITLHKGEILVEVAKDASRPFIVETPQGTARALGTKYIVRRDGNVTTVSVIESVVQACAAKSYFNSSKEKCVRLESGHGTNMTTGTIKQPMPIDIEAASAWSDGMLAVDDRPLSEVLLELERYRVGRIHFDASEISDLRVSGVFPLNDTDRALEVLTGQLPITATRYTSLLTVVAAQ